MIGARNSIYNVTGCYYRLEFRAKKCMWLGWHFGLSNIVIRLLSAIVNRAHTYG